MNGTSDGEENTTDSKTSSQESSPRKRTSQSSGEDAQPVSLFSVVQPDVPFNIKISITLLSYKRNTAQNQANFVTSNLP